MQQSRKTCLRNIHVQKACHSYINELHSYRSFSLGGKYHATRKKEACILQVNFILYYILRAIWCQLKSMAFSSLCRRTPRIVLLLYSTKASSCIELHSPLCSGENQSSSISKGEKKGELNEFWNEKAHTLRQLQQHNVKCVFNVSESPWIWCCQRRCQNKNMISVSFCPHLLEDRNGVGSISM